MEPILDALNITVWKYNATVEVKTILEFEYIESFGELILYCKYPNITVDGIDDLDEDVRWQVKEYLGKPIRHIYWTT